MENTTTALVVATVVVVILLLSCWDSKPSTSKSNSKPCPPPVVVLKNPDIDEYDKHQRSDPMHTTATGNRNVQLRKQFNDLENASGYQDWSAAAQYMALDPEVYDSHNTFASHIGIANRGASTQTLRSDPNDVNQWVGLRRPRYHDTMAEDDARVQHSEYADSMPVATGYLIQ